MKARHICYSLFFSLTVLACKTSKKQVTNTQKVLTKKEYKLDTIGHHITITPDPGCTLRLSSVVAYVVADSTPSVKLSIYPPVGKPEIMLLSNLQNMNAYSFGGGARFVVLPGGKAVIEIYNVINGAPIDGKIMLAGTNEK